MNLVPVASEGDATTAPGREVIPGRVGAGTAEGGDEGGAPGYTGSREGAPAQPERRRRRAATAATRNRVCGLWAGDTPTRSGRTLLPSVPGLNQECPPLAGMSPESACTLQLLLPAVLLAEETPLWLVSVDHQAAGGVVPPGGAGVTIFASCMNGVSRSIGTGKMVVELFSAATSDSV